MRGRKALFGAAAATIVVVVSALLVEVVLRAYAAVAHDGLAEALQRDPYAVVVEPHGQSGYRPLPHRTLDYADGAAAHTNAMGFRGPEVRIPKPDGTFRILLLGGSTTFGWGVDDDDTIDRHMSAILRERYPGRSFDVVNLAFDGYDSWQLLERIRSDGARYEPDVVIVNTGVNDVSHAWYRDLQDGDRRNLLYRSTMDRLRDEQRRGHPRLWTRAKHWLYIPRVPGWLLAELRRGIGRRAAVDMPAPTPYWDVLEYFQRNLERIGEVVTGADRAVVLFSTPPSSLSTRYEPDQPPLRYYWITDARTTQIYRDSLSARMRGVSDALAAKGLAVRYVPHAELAPELFLDDAHLTAAGNRRVAEDFVAALEPWIAGGAGRRP